MSTQNPAQVFSEKWDLYKKLMLGNYLHHADFSEKTQGILKGFQLQQLRVLDIGCGDGLPVLPHLLRFEKIAYTGYDLSASALESAATNLSPVQGLITLKEGNMLMLLQEETSYFDCIISSFAIHHIQDNEKLELLENCLERLVPGGIMIYTDVFLISQANREEYLNEYLANIRNNWTLITDEEKQPIIDHISLYDFPARLDSIINHSKSIGFTVTKMLQPDAWLAMLLLTKES